MDHFLGCVFVLCRWNQIEDHDTSHMSIVDKERNAVSLTTSINSYFGAKILSPNTGIILNNHMDDFSIPTNPSSKIHPHAPTNFISPGKRPLSSATPTIVIKVYSYLVSLLLQDRHILIH